MLLCPRHFPGKNAGVGFHFFLQGVFLTQPWNLCLLHWRVDSLPLNHLRSSGGQVELLLIYKCRRWGFGEFTNMPGAGKPAGSPGRMQSLACLAAGPKLITGARKPQPEGQSWTHLFFFFFNSFIFNWRIIASQCCVGFCHVSTWISQPVSQNGLHIYEWLEKRIKKNNISWHKKVI